MRRGARWDAFAAYRAMWLADAADSFSTTGVRDASGASGGFAGRQIEARVRYWLVPGDSCGPKSMRCGWPRGQFLRKAPNAPATGDTHYLATPR